MSRRSHLNRSPVTFLSREDSFLAPRRTKPPTAVDRPTNPARRMVETASRRRAMTLAPGNHRLPSADESRSSPVRSRPGAPRPRLGRAPRQLLVGHAPAVAPVGRDHQRPGVAAGQQLVVEAAAVGLDVGQQAAIAVAALAVEEEADGAPLE